VFGDAREAVDGVRERYRIRVERMDRDSQSRQETTTIERLSMLKPRAAQEVIDSQRREQEEIVIVETRSKDTMHRPMQV